MELIVEPADGPVDEVPRIRVQGTPPGVPVEVTVEVTDAGGHRWRSVTPHPGSDPAQPWWDMAFVDDDVAPTAFAAPADRLTYRVSAVAGTEHAAVDVVRRWAGDDVGTGTVDGDGFRLATFTPPAADAGGVLVDPGSTGVAAVAPQAALLASKGYRTAVLAYADAPGLPAAHREIPLEVLAAGYRAFAGEDATVVVAASVGTGGVLAMLAATPQVRPAGVVAIAPTCVNWQALPAGGPPAKTSMWTLRGEALPWVPGHGETALGQVLRHATVDRLRRHPTTHALQLRAGYAKGLADDAARAAAVIPVERIDCPLLLLSGDADAMWPSSEMAAAILARRRRDDDAHLSFPDAGHFLRPPVTPTTVPHNDDLVSGGTPTGNARAQQEGWAAITAFVARRLGPVSRPGS